MPKEPGKVPCVFCGQNYEFHLEKLIKALWSFMVMGDGIKIHSEVLSKSKNTCLWKGHGVHNCWVIAVLHVKHVLYASVYANHEKTHKRGVRLRLSFRISVNDMLVIQTFVMTNVHECIEFYAETLHFTFGLIAFKLVSKEKDYDSQWFVRFSWRSAVISQEFVCAKACAKMLCRTSGVSNK